MTNFAHILNELNNNFSGRNEVVDRLCCYPLLIIDDFGMERGTEYALEQIYNIMTNNRVCCLYRVSTDKQVDFNSNHEADLPMQRKACHKFAEAKGWVIVHEEQEEGVSGHKVRAAARDKLQIIKDYARKGKFDMKN